MMQAHVLASPRHYQPAKKVPLGARKICDLLFSIQSISRLLSATSEFLNMWELEVTRKQRLVPASSSTAV
jgi:hypothetical protein